MGSTKALVLTEHYASLWRGLKFPFGFLNRIKSPKQFHQHLKGTMEDAEDDIAVIGIGCNFPGGKTKASFDFHRVDVSFSPVIR